eukprot:TRINITY_DN3910_c0_g1_i1.p1 TRINITY_DN3910_c0_g1~~TRINITY_DN3910_c0_g1_i1.p1  ORF type:complete len:194 (+),score=41.26 TRINITY_DN3910_c0_g1_i1:293-874(+)
MFATTLPSVKRRRPIPPICPHFARHGFCRNGLLCENSHNINDILDDATARRHKRKCRRASSVPAVAETADAEAEEETPETAAASDDESAKPQRKRRWSRTQQKEETAQAGPASAPARTPSPAAPTGMHSAGTDAFATGFIFASFLSRSNEPQLQLGCGNRLYLANKDGAPLLIAKSQFAPGVPASTPSDGSAK